MSKRDYYEILGLKKEVSEDDIKKAYRKLAKKLHPDKTNGDKKLEEEFKAVSEAHEVLSDKEKRAKYDRFGHTQQGEPGMRRNYYRKQTMVGETLNLLLKITLEEVYSGVKKRYKYNREDNCKSCNGVGGDDIHTCELCDGAGIVMRDIKTPIGIFQQPMICDKCNGVGTSYKNECNSCKGSGLTTIEEVIEIDVPVGVKDGMTFIMKGKGHSIKGGQSGDLHITIEELPHKIFTRNGDDLKMNLKLKYTQLVLGDKIEIDTIDGGRIRVTIPDHSDVGNNLKVPKKGLIPFQSTNRGDLILSLSIEIPKTISDYGKELLEKLKDLI